VFGLVGSLVVIWRKRQANQNGKAE
jgi:hypothetical protein